MTHLPASRALTLGLLAALAGCSPADDKQLTAASPVATAQIAPAAPKVADLGERKTEWGYVGPGGPDHWAELSEDYKICSTGQQESPLNLTETIAAELSALNIDWPAMPLKIANTGHSIEVEAEGGMLTVQGRRLDLVQFHLHHPSEHLIGERRFPIELHFVHRDAKGLLGVIAVFFAEGKANAALEPILANMPATRGAAKVVPGVEIRPLELLPRKRGYYRYEGSLTTPPCSEDVDWLILAEPLEASPAQIAALERLYPNNARPLQKANRRFILRSAG